MWRTVELKTARLLLRRYTMEDAAVIHKELGCKSVMYQYTGWNPYSTLESTEKTIAEYIAGYDHFDGGFGWVIESEGVAVGIIGAYDFNEEENSIEIGYSIFESSWRKGYGSEAAKAVCAFLKELGIAKAVAWSAVENTASGKILESCGFVLKEKRSAGINVGSDSYDQLIYELNMG